MAPTGTTWAGTTTTGGAGGGSIVAQGSLSLYLTTAGGVCPAAPHWINVPFAAQGGQQTTASMKGATAIDGQDQMSISCSVKPTASGFDVTASLRSPAFEPTTHNPVNPTAVTLSTTIAAGQSAPGSVAVMDSKTVSQYESTNDMGQPAPTCMFSVQPAAAGDQLGVAAGRIWASVACAKFRDPTSPDLSETCAITQGHIVLENCAR
jgi:hypothetical protein